MIEGTVKNLTDFGAFIDLGGADGLLHISEMSWGRVDDPKKLFKVGDKVNVMIKDIQGTKIALTMKLDENNPWKNASEIAKQQKQEEKKVEFKENGFISVSVGDGLTDLFHELGVDEVIEGGQTMNPSTEDILGAIEKIPAKNIYILPNNGNIILAAQQAKDLTKDKAVHVIPTKNIPQGIAAMINFVEGFTPEQNEEAMTEALSEVKSGQVTYAVRDTVIDGKEIKAGNIMGLSDKTIEIVGTDVVDTTIDLLKKMMDEESELITIYYGEEGTKEDAEKIAKAIEGIDDEMEVEIQYGGQPIYYYFVSVE